MFPTPPPPVHPLPTREYHGPRDLLNEASPSATPPANPASTPVPPQPKGRKRSGEPEPPAHEIECIARVTLALGPMSFHGTELWVGRFVEPRANKPKKERAKPGERREREKKRREGIEKERQRTHSGPSATPKPAASVARPTVATAGPSAPRMRPPAPGPAVTNRTAASPQLIQLVNQAASRHPWLSSLIYKAAGSTANQDELERLGRAVARLSKGEAIDDLAPQRVNIASSEVLKGKGKETAASTSHASKTSVPAVPGPSSLSEKPTSAPAPLLSQNTSSSTLTPVVPAEKDKEDKKDDAESDWDSEVEMKGPKQVGGGPIGPSTLDSAAAASTIPLTSTATQPSYAPSSVPASQAANPSVPSPVPGIVPSPIPVSASTSSAVPLSPHAPPPKPNLPNPPPFLLIAFKEHPTDKFLIPLGSRSFVSRVGGDWVTSKPPHLAPDTTLPLGQSLETSGNTNPTVAPQPAAQAAISRELQALQSSAKSSSFELEAQSHSKRRGRTHVRPTNANSPSPAPPKVKTKPIEEPSLTTTTTTPEFPPLPQLPGQNPPPGTVLISTLVPANKWNKVDWASLGKKVPWSEDWNSKVKAGTNENVREEEPLPLPLSDASSQNHVQLLNLAAEDFLPENGPLKAITIRLGQVDDQIWGRMKDVMTLVDRAEIMALSAMGVLPPAPDSITHPADDPEIREAYLLHKTSLFSSLMGRTRQPRRFLHTRPSSPPAALVDATVDKMAPRPYPISTKPLYHVEEGDNEMEGRRDSVRQWSPDVEFDDGLGRRKKKKTAQETVGFEMPVSLEALDERVEASAQKALLGKRGRAGGGEGARKEKQRRGIEKGICEGCAREGIKIWRRGPSGKGTLCNSCGDLFTEGKLQYSDLKAPGAMKTLLAANQDVSGADAMHNQVEEKNDSVPVKAEQGRTTEEALGDGTAINSEEQKETSTQVVQAERPPEHSPQHHAVESQPATQSLPETIEPGVDMQNQKSL